MKQNERFAGLAKYEMDCLFDKIKTPAYVLDEARRRRQVKCRNQN